MGSHRPVDGSSDLDLSTIRVSFPSPNPGCLFVPGHLIPVRESRISATKSVRSSLGMPSHCRGPTNWWGRGGLQGARLLTTAVCARRSRYSLAVARRARHRVLSTRRGWRSRGVLVATRLGVRRALGSGERGESTGAWLTARRSGRKGQKGLVNSEHGDCAVRAGASKYAETRPPKSQLGFRDQSRTSREPTSPKGGGPCDPGKRRLANMARGAAVTLALRMRASLSAICCCLRHKSGV
jgi:hypothetical protein